MALVWERPAAPAVSQAACSNPSALGWFSPQTSCNAKWIRWKPSKTLTLKSYIVLQNDLIAQQTCTPEFQLLLHLRVTTSNQPRTDLTQRRRLTSTNPGIERDRALGFPVTTSKDKAPHGAHFVGMWMVCCKMVTRHGCRWMGMLSSVPRAHGRWRCWGPFKLAGKAPVASRELGWKGADPNLLYFK